MLIPLFSSKVEAGFPSPATDYIEKTLDLNELCIEHPNATFFLRANGNSMIEVGIFTDDILIVDRSLTAKHGDIVIAALNGEFTVKELSTKPVPKLVPKNPNYSDIIINEGDDFEIFGVVTFVIHSLKTALMNTQSCYALVDIDNFFVSCERLFRPDLKNKPVLVLSNNDGCVVSRSQEVKELGIKMAVPFYQVKHLVAKHQITVFSSNYGLYGSLSQRVMNTLESIAPDIEVYSIDEAFLNLTNQYEAIDQTALTIKATLKQHLGLAIGIGMAPTKTLAKLANYAAKKYKATGGIVNLMDPSRQERLLKITPVGEIWGVGRKTAEKLEQLDIKTGLDLRDSDATTLQSKFSVVLNRTIQELRGMPCNEFMMVEPHRQQILNSRSFGQPVTQLSELKEAVATYAEKAAIKLRNQGLLTKHINVFISTNRFQNGHYANEISIPLTTATDDTRTITKTAIFGLEKIWRENTHYIKAGVCLRNLSLPSNIQQDLFSLEQSQVSSALMKTIDGLNQRYGNAIHLAALGTNQNWMMRRNNLSPSYTTKWTDLASTN